MNYNGVHLIPVHNRTADYDYIAATKPGIVKIVDADIDHIRRVREALDGDRSVTIVLRNHARSEDKQAMEENPYATGQRHAREWIDDLKRLGVYGDSNVWVEGVNEPNLDAGPRPSDIFSDEYQAWLKQTRYLASNVDSYIIGLIEEGQPYLNVYAYLFSVGWPTNLKEGEAPYWDYFNDSLNVIEKYGARIGLHEYFPEDGPSWNAGWYAYRWKHMPRTIRVDILEAGMDVYTKHSIMSDPQRRGYLNWVTPEINAHFLHEYCMECRRDPRFGGFTPFTSDGSAEWSSYDMLHSYSEMLKLDWSGKPNGETVKPEQKIIWPTKGVTTQRFGENYERYMAMFGAAGHNGIDIANSEGTAIHAVADGVVAWSGWDKEYGYYIRLWHPGLSIHSFYAHLKHNPNVSGDVRQGDLIGVMGNTGNSTGPHLHFELRAGTEFSYDSITYGHTKGRFNPEIAYYLSGSAKVKIT